jgi:hypothetical protein
LAEEKNKKVGTPKPATEKLNAGDKIELMSGLLDYYASRATSFASLFIAAVFGVVALSTIIKGIGVSNYSLFCYAFSFIPYFAFIGLTWITWQRFQYWKNIADRIERNGLRKPEIHKTFLKTVKVGKTNLYDYMYSKYLEAEENPWRKHTVNRLGTIFSVTIIFLTLIVLGLLF